MFRRICLPPRHDGRRAKHMPQKPTVKDFYLGVGSLVVEITSLRLKPILLSQNVRVQLESLESPELYAARASAVKTDPRVRSLSPDHMLRWNSLDPESDDLARFTAAR